MYHRIQTAMVAHNGGAGEGTIVLMREDALTGQHQGQATSQLPLWACWLGHQTLPLLPVAVWAASVL